MISFKSNYDTIEIGFVGNGNKKRDKNKNKRVIKLKHTIELIN